MTKKTRGSKQGENKGCCQVCRVNLTSIKAKEYCHRKKVCPEHLQADAVKMPGKDCLHRFCHQCGKFEPLTNFDGVRRSCRDRLVLRRKPVPGSTATDSASTGPASPTVLECNTAALTAASAEWSQDNGGDTTACSALNDVSSMGAQQLEDFLQAQLASTAAAAITAAAPARSGALLLQPQQQGFLGMLHDGSSCAPALKQETPAAAAPAKNFEEFLEALMEEELQQCLLQQQQQQAASMSLGGQSLSALLAPSGFMSSAQQTSAAASFNNACGLDAACIPPGVGNYGSASDTSSNSIAPRDVYAAAAAAHHTPSPHVAPAPRTDASASRRQQLLLQVQDLLHEERMLRQAGGASADTMGCQSAACTLPAHQPAAGVFRLQSDASTASTLTASGPFAGANLLPHDHLLLQQQQQQAAVAEAARQQHEALVAARMQRLHTQFLQVSAQLSQLRGMVAGCAPPSGLMPAAVTSTGAPPVIHMGYARLC